MTNYEYQDLEKVTDKIYLRGYAEGVENTRKEFEPELIRAREEGLNDAWECARKIDTNRDLENYVFGNDLDNGYYNLSASEAIAKVKEYEEKQTEDEWHDIPTEEMNEKQLRKAVRELREYSSKLRCELLKCGVRT